MGYAGAGGGLVVLFLNAFPAIVRSGAADFRAGIWVGFLALLVLTAVSASRGRVPSSTSGSGDEGRLAATPKWLPGGWPDRDGVRIAVHVQLCSAGAGRRGTLLALTAPRVIVAPGVETDPGRGYGRGGSVMARPAGWAWNVS